MQTETETNKLNRQISSLRSLFWPPPLLANEDLRKFEEVLAWYFQSIKPRNFFEQVLVRDYVYEVWKKVRLERLQTGLHQAELDDFNRLNLEAGHTPPDRTREKAELKADAKLGESGAVLMRTEEICWESAATVSRGTALPASKRMERLVRVKTGLDQLISECVKRRNACMLEIEMCRAMLRSDVAAKEPLLVEKIESETSETVPLVPDART